MSNESNFAPEKTGAKFFHRKDLYLALVLVAFGAFVYYEAGKFPPAPAVLGDTINADVFPKILVVILLFLTDFLGAVLTMFVICLLLPIVWGEKNYVAVAIYALLFPAFVWFLFNQLLGLYFAPGLLEVFLK